MKESDIEYKNQIGENIISNTIIQNENSQNKSNINTNVSDINNMNIINEENINNDSIQNNEININHSLDNNQNINQIITNENLEEANNNIANDSINLDEEEVEEEKFSPTFTFSFKLFFILNSFSYYYTYYKTNKIKKFSLCLWPVLNKNQYFRLITSHFCYKGFLDYFLSMLGLFYITKYLEREIGSLYFFLIAIHGMIFTSFLFLSLMWMLKFLFKAITLSLTEQGSFAGVDFCLFLSYFLLKKNKTRNVNLNSFDLKGVYLVFLLILLIQFLYPSSMFILNISGTLSAFLIFKISKNTSLPKNNWVTEMEKILGLDNINNVFKNLLGYYSLNDNENIIDNVKEFDNFGRYI